MSLVDRRPFASTTLAALLLAALAAACSSGGPTGSGETTTSSCASDADCKGSRVCSSGTCVDPAGGAGPAGAGGTSAQAGAKSSGAGGQVGGQTGTGGAPGGTGGNAFGGGGSPGGGGVGSGTGSAPQACNITYDGSTCDGCFQSKCKTQCADCSGNPDCMLVLECINKCTTSACVDSCATAFPKGVAPINAVIACASSPSICGPVCDTGYVTAASCSYDYQCSPGSCTGSDGSNGFCTASCSNSDQCGKYAWCSLNASNSYSCFPACSTSSDCAYLGAGFTCGTGKTKEGSSVGMCAIWN